MKSFNTIIAPSEHTNINPVIKWAGGKTQLLPEIRKRMPAQFNRYFEPFLGGAAVYLDLLPETCTLSDTNSQLINVYRQIQAAPEMLINELQMMQEAYNRLPDLAQKDSYFYSCRECFNNCIKENILSVTSAALFIFLNKSCFNGLYRENRKGEFNVSSGHKKTVNAFCSDNIFKMSQILKTATLLNEDFEVACQNARRGDFIFFDSPYHGTFDTYQSMGFDEESHKRLASLVSQLTNKGVMCMLTNSDTDFIRNLYGSFHIETVQVRRNICCKGDKRTGTEIIITNY